MPKSLLLAVSAGIVALVLALATPPLIAWGHGVAWWIRVPLIMVVLGTTSMAAIVAGAAWQDYRATPRAGARSSDEGAESTS